MDRFWDIGLVSLPWPWYGLGVIKVIRTDKDWSATYDFPVTLYSNYGPISYRFRDKGWFQSKNAKFSHPMYFCAPAEGVSLEIGYQRTGQKRSDGLLAKKEVWRHLQWYGYNAPTWWMEGQMDRQADGHQPQQRPCLCIALHGKKNAHILQTNGLPLTNYTAK